MGKKIKRILFIILILVAVFLFVVPIAKTFMKEEVTFTLGLTTPEEFDRILKEKHEEMKNIPSDIEGWSQYDKYKKMLIPEDGSDTDKDGLTDKEEIEIYDSNPHKMSTSGDLYGDKYKAEHGMDLNKKYKYEGEIQALYNECEEVILELESFDDLYAGVADMTGVEYVEGYESIKQYLVQNYSKKLSIDLTEVLAENDLTIDDIEIWGCGGFPESATLQKYKFKADGNIAKLKKRFNRFCSYDIFVIVKPKDVSPLQRFLNPPKYYFITHGRK